LTRLLYQTDSLPLATSMIPARKKILFVSRHSPYGSSLAKEALDAVLAASAYDQDISLLFMDDGIFQLLNAQETTDIQQKNFAMMIPVLSLYDVHNVYVHQESLETRQILASELIGNNIQVVDSAAVAELVDKQDQLLSF
jgi:tRNA 2-thiouridine synthesizing protein C